jgi:hypothetical protein
MAMLVERAQIACKVEAAEGTAETLAGADAILAMNVSFKPNIVMKERLNITSSLSAWSQVPGSRSAVLEFDVELKGSGTAGTAPALGKLMKACGFGETISGGVSVTYAPASSGAPSMTLAYYNDGLIYKIWGARGNVTLKSNKGELGTLHFTMTGADFSILDGAMLTTGVSYETTKPQPFLGAASFTIDSYVALIGAVEFNMNNVISLRSDITKGSGNISALIVDRKPTLTFDPEAITVATYDFFGKWRSQNEGALGGAVWGATAGNICTVTAPKVQYITGAVQERGQIRSFGITCQLNRNAGDDEISIVFT